MNFFTPDWHSGKLDDKASADVWRNYQTHLVPLLPRLPQDVKKLAAQVNLHDGLLQKVTLDLDKASLLLNLRCGDLQVGYFDLDLHYFDVLLSATAIKNIQGLFGNPSELDLHNHNRRSEALYDEVDIEGEMVVHRILFESRRLYYELLITFKQLRLEITPRQDRYGP